MLTDTDKTTQGDVGTDAENTESTNLKPRIIEFIIPECCVEGWNNCQHVRKPESKREINSAF
mgnify:CR=1 FL=1